MENIEVSQFKDNESVSAVQPDSVPEYKQNKVEFHISASKLCEFLSYAAATNDEEVGISIDNTGWSIRTMDRAHISLIDMQLLPIHFEHYDHEYPVLLNELKITLRSEEVVKALKSFKTKRYESDIISVTVDNERCKLILSNESTSQTLPLIENSLGRVPMPKLTFGAEITINSEELLKRVEAIHKLSDYLTINLKEPKYINDEGYIFELSGNGDSGAIVNSSIVTSTTATIREKNQLATYSLDYLLPILKLMKPSGLDLRIEFSTNMPLRLSFDSVSDHFRVHFYLAPRVQD